MSAPTLAVRVEQACDALSQYGNPSFRRERAAVAELVKVGTALARGARACKWDEADAWDTALSALASALGVSDA